MRLILSFAIGLLFGVGLCLSGMTQPSKVQGFLDVAGLWDPSLAFVMGGAITVGLPFFRIAKRRERSALGDPIRLPAENHIDRPLVLGSAIFGVGWGLSGVCPGPGIVDVGFLNAHALVFVAAMFSGLALERIVLFHLSKSAPLVPED